MATAAILIETLNIIKEPVTLFADGNECVKRIFVAKLIVGQVMHLGRRPLAHNALSVIDGQALCALGLPLWRRDVLVIVRHCTSQFRENSNSPWRMRYANMRRRMKR